MSGKDRRAACETALRRAADWLVDRAQIADPATQPFDDLEGYPHGDYTGATRTEYDTKTRRWAIDGPCFHTGQAVRSLLVAERRTGDSRYRRGALAGGEFLLRERIAGEDHPQRGLLMSLEQNDDEINVQVTFEALSGALDLHALTGDERYLELARTSADLLIAGAFLPDERLMLDHYSLRRRAFFHDPDNMLAGRAMVDDAVLARLGERTGDQRYTDLFLAMAGRLLEAEGPSGTWLHFPPWPPSRGRIHNRKSWWWGWPLLTAWDLSGDVAFREAAIRCGDWYLRTQNLDGGLYYTPSPDERHNTFGSCTSVVACAVILWADLYQRFGEERFLDGIRRGVGFLLAAQFAADVEDPDVRGALFESPRAPDGSLAPGFRVRDIAAIFAIRAWDAALDLPALLDVDDDWIDTTMAW